MSYRDEVMALRAYGSPEADDLRDKAASIAARADARIAELKRNLAFARVGSDRYQIARRMNPRQWATAWQVNVKLGKPFDQIIDEMRPFVMGAVGESGDAG